ncbi:MAG: MFS transporter [Acidobacteria bacterium]|nr:MFS transporter [Acidobacteriota bacterium]
MIKPTNSPTFYGWRIVAASFFTLGLAVGLPYFGMPFFYDYFERPISEGGFGWSRSTITLGLPLGTIATLWVGPLLAHRFPPRRLILLGTGLTALVLVGFGRMNGSVWLYWSLWVAYMIGNVFSGGLSHQVILSHWFVKHRGTALSIAYLGISFIGAVSARFVVKPLSETFGFRMALQLMAGLLLLTWPLVWWVMKEKPADLGLLPDGEASSETAPVAASESLTPQQILRQRAFWVLLIGGCCSTGAFAAVSQHLKLILKDSGFNDQNALNLAFSQTMLVLLIASAAGRLLVGRLSDRLPKRHVLTLAYLLLAMALPMLFFVKAPATPYLFATLFGLAMGSDFLLTALIAADQYSVASLARVLAILFPAMTIGQTWLPYFIALLREWTGSYSTPLLVAFGLAAAGRLTMTLLPTAPDNLLPLRNQPHI